jgi:hypothetical protein
MSNNIPSVNYPIDTSEPTQPINNDLIFSDKDSDLDLPGNEFERINRLEQRLHRLAEKLQEIPPENINIRIKRNQYLMKQYELLKTQIAQTLENYTLRTGDTLLPKELLDKKILYNNLPPSNVNEVIDEYSRSIRDRVDNDDSDTPQMLPGNIAQRILDQQETYHNQQAEIAREQNAGSHTLLSMHKNGQIVSGEGGRPIMTVGDGDLPHGDIRVHMLNPPNIVNQYTAGSAMDEPLLSHPQKILGNTVTIANPIDPLKPVLQAPIVTPNKYTILPLPPMEATDLNEHILQRVASNVGYNDLVSEQNNDVHDSVSLLETKNQVQIQIQPIMIKKIQETENMKLPFILPQQK